MRSTRKQREREASAAAAEVAPTRRVTRRMIEGTIRTLERNAAAYMASGRPVSAERCQSRADEARERLAAYGRDEEEAAA